MQIPEYRFPGFLALANSAFTGQQHLPAIGPHSDDDQQRGFVIGDAGFYVQTIGPHINDFRLAEILDVPSLILGLPLRFQSLDRCFR